jgi:hypothetical protein
MRPHRQHASPPPVGSNTRGCRTRKFAEPPSSTTAVTYLCVMTFECPTCGDELIAVPNDDPAYGPSTLYFCETAGAAHVPFGWAPGASAEGL